MKRFLAAAIMPIIFICTPAFGHGPPPKWTICLIPCVMPLVGIGKAIDNNCQPEQQERGGVPIGTNSDEDVENEGLEIEEME